MKKIFSFFVALTAVVSLSAKTVYLNTASSDWADADAVTFIHAWGGEVTTTNVQMLPVEGDSTILSAECDDNNTSIVFVRMPAGSTAIVWDGDGKYWNKTADQVIPDGQNMFTVTGFENEIANGDWSTYGEVVLPSVSIVGNFEGDATWGQGSHPMTPAEDNLSASVTFTIPAATYEMKVWVDGNYLSLNGADDTMYRIHRDWNHADNVNLVNNGRNFEFVADVTGDYTFTWTYASQNLVVTFPELTGIENTNADAKAVKRVINGQLVILRDGKTFNALGAEMK